MTDHALFQPAHGVPDNTHQGYCDAPLFGFVLRVRDWRLQPKRSEPTSALTLKTRLLRRDSRAKHMRLHSLVTGARTPGPACMFLVLCLAALCLPAINASAQERCTGAAIDVTAPAAEERRLVCSAASDALQLLGRCGISLQRPLQVHILNEVRHPLSGPIFGLFDTKQERVLVTQEARLPSLARGTPYDALPKIDFYRSLIVHEVVHGVMHQNLKRPATSHAAYEYPAYALQIESLPSNVRDMFLQSSIGDRGGRDNSIFNDTVLFFDPFYFAARAYKHFKSTANGCANLTALLDGEVSFIATLP
jgi:uncharacterized protein DUF6639